jgi:predicted secreted protein
MSVFKSLPISKIVNGVEVTVAESVVVTDKKYTTEGESFIVVKNVDTCELFLNSQTTDHVVVKSLTNVLVKSNELIDEEFNEVELNKGSCVEFKKIGDYWYILSSDGLKNS